MTTASPVASPRDKILTTEQLAEKCRLAKADGKVVAHAHGTFDLLHLGHVRHLEAAKALGDVLIVTLTGDLFVNKGPGRPVFTQDLRAEMVAALGFIDYVGINLHHDAVPVITAIQPDIYVKGQDYLDPDGDITGKIKEERDAVEAHGGRIEFTTEITFSSSELINRHLNVFEPHVRSHLDTLRNDGSLDQLNHYLDKVSEYKILMVGETIVDEYHYVQPMGKAAKENIIATRFESVEVFAGGVIAAANHAASFCKEVEIVTCLGANDPTEKVIRAALKPNVTLTPVYLEGVPTVRKVRFVDPGYIRKLFEVCYLDDAPLLPEAEDRLLEILKPRLAEADCVITTDFGHGMINRRVIDTLAFNARFLAVNTQTNSANIGFNLITRYPRADYICIDAPEARMATHDRLSPISDVASRILPRLVRCPRIVITHGKHGCVTYQAGEPVHTMPAFTQRVVDTVGAGDAFFAVTAPLVAAGAPVSLAGFAGNVVGSLKVEIVGHRKSVDKVAFLKAVTALTK